MRASLFTLLSLAAALQAREDNEVRNKANNLLAGHFKLGQQLSNGAHGSPRVVPRTVDPLQPPLASPTSDAPAVGGSEDDYVTILQRVKMPSATSHSIPRTVHTLPEADARPPAPHIRDTIKAIRPIVNAVLSHPTRYLFLAIKAVFRFLWSIVRFVVGFAWILLRPFIIPFYLAVVLPFGFVLNLTNELQPLLTFLLSGTLLGLAIGVMAGYSNGFISDNLLTSSKLPSISPTSSPTRSRRPLPAYAPGRSTFGAADGDDEEDTATEDEDSFRASLRFQPMPPPYGRRPPVSASPLAIRERGYFSDDGEETETLSTDDDDARTPTSMGRSMTPITYVTPPTPPSQMGTMSYDSGSSAPGSPTVELRRRTVGRQQGSGSSASTASTSTSSEGRPMPPSALARANSKDNKGKGPGKAVRWEE